MSTQTVSLVFPGGSSKAYVTTAVACELERRVNEISGRKHLCDHTTLSTGSSGGVFPAATIANKESLSELLYMFEPEFSECVEVTSREGLSWFVLPEGYRYIRRPRVSLLLDPLYPEGAIRAAKRVFGETATFADCGCKLNIAATAVKDNQGVTITRGPIWEAAAASAAVPRVFSPIHVPIENIDHVADLPKGVYGPTVKLYDASHSGQYLPAITAAQKAKEQQKENPGRIVTVYFDHTPGIDPGVSWFFHGSSLTWALSKSMLRKEEEKRSVMDEAATILGEDTANTCLLQVPYPAPGISPIDFSPETMCLLKDAADKYIKDEAAQLDKVARMIVGEDS